MQYKFITTKGIGTCIRLRTFLSFSSFALIFLEISDKTLFWKTILTRLNFLQLQTLTKSLFEDVYNVSKILHIYIRYLFIHVTDYQKSNTI